MIIYSNVPVSGSHLLKRTNKYTCFQVSSSVLPELQKYDEISEAQAQHSGQISPRDFKESFPSKRSDCPNLVNDVDNRLLILT